MVIKKNVSNFSLFKGASYPFIALSVFAKNISLIVYLIIPITINFILGIIIYTSLIISSKKIIPWGLEKLSTWTEQMLASLPTWLGVIEYLILGLGWLISGILIIILFALTGVILLQFGVILGAPWYGKLSEKLEKFRTNQLEIIEVGILKDIGRAILFEIKKLILIITVGFPLFLINFLPIIGTIIATVGGLILTVTIVCLDFFDSPLERRRFRFREKLTIIRQSLPASAGFGLVCLGLISIPLLNLITIPLCVSSGTLFFCDQIWPNLKTKKTDNYSQENNKI